MKTVAQKISESISIHGFATVKECAQTLGLPYELLRKVVGEDHVPKDSQLLLYASKLKIDPKELLFVAYYQKAPEEFKKYFHNKPPKEDPDIFNRIPVLKWNEVRDFISGGSLLNKSTSQPHMVSTLKGEHLVALTVKDDAMKPIFSDGDTIIVDLSSVPNNGDFALVDIKGEEPIMRQCRQLGNIRMLCPVNPIYDEYDVTKNVKLIGRVIRKQVDY